MLIIAVLAHAFARSRAAVVYEVSSMSGASSSVNGRVSKAVRWAERAAQTRNSSWCSSPDFIEPLLRTCAGLCRRVAIFSKSKVSASPRRLWEGSADRAFRSGPAVDHRLVRRAPGSAAGIDFSRHRGEAGDKGLDPAPRRRFEDDLPWLRSGLFCRRCRRSVPRRLHQSGRPSGHLRRRALRLVHQAHLDAGANSGLAAPSGTQAGTLFGLARGQRILAKAETTSAGRSRPLDRRTAIRAALDTETYDALALACRRPISIHQRAAASNASAHRRPGRRALTFHQRVAISAFAPARR